MSPGRGSWLHPARPQHYLHHAIEHQHEDHREQHPQCDEMARLAMGEVTHAVLPTLHAEGRRQHTLQHLPESRWLVLRIVIHCRHWFFLLSVNSCVGTVYWFPAFAGMTAGC